MNGPELKPCVQEHLNALMERFPALTVVKQDIVDAFVLIKDCYEQGHKILIAGNGGSAADSEHIAGELMKRFGNAPPGKRGVSPKAKGCRPGDWRFSDPKTGMPAHGCAPSSARGNDYRIYQRCWLRGRLCTAVVWFWQAG